MMAKRATKLFTASEWKEKVLKSDIAKEVRAKVQYRSKAILETQRERAVKSRDALDHWINETIGHIVGIATDRDNEIDRIREIDKALSKFRVDK